MGQSVYEKVKRHVEKFEVGSVFVTRDFLAAGSRASVDEALSRLTKECVVRRLRRGLYEYPRLHPSLGLVPAEPELIAAALARKSGDRIQKSGAGAANALGLSTQIPAHAVYLTDGRTRRIKVGGQVFDFHHAVPRSMTAAGTIERTVIQALRYLGANNVDDTVVQQLRRTLSTNDKARLLREAVNAPAWLTPILRQVAL